jgi:hypothetical protein
MSSKLVDVGEFSYGAEADGPAPVRRPPAGYLPYGERKPYVVARLADSAERADTGRGHAAPPPRLVWSP